MLLQMPESQFRQRSYLEQSAFSKDSELEMATCRLGNNQLSLVSRLHPRLTEDHSTM